MLLTGKNRPNSTPAQSGMPTCSTARKLRDADDCDEDGNIYEPDEDIPCPMCDPKGAVKYWAERHEIGGSSRRTAVRHARLLVADIRGNRGVRDMVTTPPDAVTP